MATQFTHADHLDILCGESALRFASADFFRDDPRWTFPADFNCDGLITISDVWSAVGWFFFLPGDFAVFAICTFAPGLAQFFELSRNFYGAGCLAFSRPPSG